MYRIKETFGTDIQTKAILENSKEGMKDFNQTEYFVLRYFMIYQIFNNPGERAVKTLGIREI